ncbi:MAG: hypothetical protein JSV70_03340 [bacterium]|nr:MAG: hypothetical protein JSV70_03340 [bacterium]
MPFLDPTAEFDPEVRPYKEVLENFSRFLASGNLMGLPEPAGKLGPIRSVHMSRAVREDGAEVLGQVLEHALYLLKGDPNREPELRFNFNMLLLMDVFGLDEEEAARYEPAMNVILW